MILIYHVSYLRFESGSNRLYRIGESEIRLADSHKVLVTEDKYVDSR